MKKLLLLVALATSTALNAQWVSKAVDNGLDEPYRICYNKNQYGEILKMENVRGQIVLYVYDITSCVENDVNTNISFLVNGVWKRYTFYCGYMNDDSVLIIKNLSDSDNSDVLQDFKACTKIKFRFNYEVCDPEEYEFNMSGSTAAFNFISR